MATRKKSTSGAYMSKYDTEVEERLKALETAVAALESHTHDKPESGNDFPNVQEMYTWYQDVKKRV